MVGRNPKQPEKDVTIPARATVKFKAGKIMRQRVLLPTSYRGDTRSGLLGPVTLELVTSKGWPR